MIVAVSDFNMGAMENKGLNIFNTKYVLANPATATDADFAGIESVVAPRVLPQLDRQPHHLPRLVPALAEGRPDGLPRPGVQHGHGRLAFGRARSSASRTCASCAALQFPEDAGPMAHPVRPDSYLEINNFYTATVYEKGAEVVRMMHTLVGREGFARGMDAVLPAPRRPGRDLRRLRAGHRRRQPGQRAGQPAGRLQALVRAGRHAARHGARRTTTPQARRYTLTLSQHGQPSPGQPAKQPFVIPVAMGLLAPTAGAAAAARGGRRRHRAPAGARPGRAELRPSSTSTRAPVPSLLRGFSAPVRAGRRPGRRRRCWCCWRTTATPSTAGKPASAWRWRALLAAVRRRAPRRCWTTPSSRRCAACCATRRWTPAFKELVLTLPSESYIAEQLRSGRPAAHPRRARGDGAQLLAAAAARRLGLGLGAAPGDRGLPARRRSRPAAARWPTWRWRMLCLHAVAQRRRGVARPRLPALQGRRQHDRPPGRAGGAGATRTRRWPTRRWSASTRCSAATRWCIDKWFALQASAPEPLGAQAGRVFARAKALLKHPDFSLQQPEPRAQPAVHAVRRQPGRLPPRRRRRLRVLGRAGAGARRHQPAAGRAPGARDGPLGAAWPSPTAARRARPSRAWPPRPT